jgi:hypothetical protein
MSSTGTTARRPCEKIELGVVISFPQRVKDILLSHKRAVYFCML